MRKLIVTLLVIVLILVLGLFTFGPGIVDRSQNENLSPGAPSVSSAAAALHDSLTVVDWHADPLLWNRNLFQPHENGHVDLPRLRQGNVALQMFTVVTKVPSGLNYEENKATGDLITRLAIVQRWPVAAWTGLKARAVYQAEKLDRIVQRSPGDMRWVRNRDELRALLEARETARASGSEPPVGAMLGMEGAHPLEGDLVNLDEFFELGYRMIGLVHFFDNGLSGSLHGIDKGGLTDFGRSAVRRMNELGMIIDVAHLSEPGVREVLAISDKPVVLSHGGMKGVCDTPRNLPDELMQQIADGGGLVAMGYWSAAVCDTSPEGIAKMIAYAVELLGADHVALGSDWDGATASIDADNIPEITQALIARGMSDEDIARVMGGSSIAFLQRWLP